VKRALAVAGPAVLLAALFVSLYRSGDNAGLVGADTPWYVWRSKVVIAEGLQPLAEPLPSGQESQTFRGGYPLLAGYAATAGLGPFDLAFAIPAGMAVVAGLGAGALAVRGAGHPLWAYPVYALIAGGSLNLVMTSVSHLDAAIVMAMAVSAAAMALTTASGERSGGAAVLVLAGAVLVHWSFAALFIAVVAATSALLLPGSLRSRRAGERFARTPSGRLGFVAAASAAAGALAILLPPELPRVFRTRGWEDDLLGRLGMERFAVLAPPSAAGALALAGAEPRRRRAVAMALVWALGGGLAVAIFLLLPGTEQFPAHRILQFSMGIPLLAAAGVVAAVRFIVVRWPGRPGRLGAAALALASVSGLTLLGATGWRTYPPTRIAEMAEVRTAGRYLEQAGWQGPVVFAVTNPRRPNPINAVRAALPLGQVLDAATFFGKAEDLLRGRPTVAPGDPVLTAKSRDDLDRLRPLLGEGPAVLVVDSLASGRLEGRPVAPGVHVVRGPRPGSSVEPAGSPLVPGWPRLAAMAGVLLAWSAGLVPGDWLTRVSMAPAIGIAVLALAGAIFERVGAGGPSARPWALALVTAMGWGTFLLRRRSLARSEGTTGRHRRTPSDRLPPR
jgi:hypothetical protein